MIGKATIYQSLGRLLPQGLGFVMGVIIVRFCSLELMGQYAEFTSILSISMGVLIAGVNNNYLRSGKLRLFKSSLLVNIFMGVLIIGLVMPVYAFIADKEYLPIALLGCAILLMRITELYNIKLRYFNKDIFIILPKSIPYVIIIVLCYIFRVTEMVYLSLIFLIAWTTPLFFIHQGRSIIKKMSTSIVECKSIIYSSVVLSATTLATQIYANVDQIMIANMMGDDQSGIYKIGVSFSVLAMPVIGVFSFIYLSQLNRYLRLNKIDLIKKKFWTQVLINFLVGLLFFLICLGGLKYIIPFVYGKSAEAAVQSAIVLSFGVIINVVSMVFFYSLLSIKKDKLVFYITLMGAISNIALNYLLIPRMGVIGAALASVGTQCVILILLLLFFFKIVNFFKFIKVEKVVI